jgi:hypothetical protein
LKVLSLLSVTEIRSQPPEPETFNYEWADSTITMQKYFIGFLKPGPNRNHSEDEAAKIQEAHLAYLGNMYTDGYSSLTGLSESNDQILGFVVRNTATNEEAIAYADGDSAAKAGRLVVEAMPWWVAKGSHLR